MRLSFRNTQLGSIYILINASFYLYTMYSQLLVTFSYSIYRYLSQSDLSHSYVLTYYTIIHIDNAVFKCPEVCLTIFNSKLFNYNIDMLYCTLYLYVFLKVYSIIHSRISSLGYMLTFCFRIFYCKYCSVSGVT